MVFKVSRSRKIKHLAAAALFFAGCVSSSVIKGSSLAGEIEKEAAALNKNMERVYELKSKRVASSGFYYVINREGRVVFHPQTILIGADMSNMNFVTAALQQGNGCIEYTLDTVDMVDRKVFILFFRLIKNDSILCLSIPKEEVSGSYGECVDFEIK